MYKSENINKKRKLQVKESASLSFEKNGNYFSQTGNYNYLGLASSSQKITLMCSSQVGKNCLQQANLPCAWPLVQENPQNSESG